MPHWTFHDLRRTMRTRLSKLGIEPEIAERVIGHVPGGVRSTYDLHQFQAEKRHALERGRNRSGASSRRPTTARWWSCGAASVKKPSMRLHLWHR